MDLATIDLYKPGFWCVLAVAVLVLVPITSHAVRKWVWAAVNLGFLGMLLGLPSAERVSELLAAQSYGEAAAYLITSNLGLVSIGVLAAWLLLHAVQHSRLGILPVVVGGLAILGLFVLHKLPASTIYETEHLRYALDSVGLFSTRVQPLKGLLVAVGFSYVALRMVDVLRLTYEGRHRAPDLPSTVNYLLPFHMLAAGPIQAYADFVAQPEVPPLLTASEALRGVERIAHGLFKKYVLTTLVVQAFLTNFRAPFPYLIVEAMLYYVWIYLDFSAYSDITVGAGRLLGVATPENFNKPYIARNLIDFWDRWHMSLSQFIYRNIFVPVQLFLVRRSGPQAALWCAAVAFSVSFLLCGLWHELNWRWAAWGMMHAMGLVTVNFYRAWLQKHLSREAYNRYRTHRGIRVAAIILTQVFAAATLVVVGWPRQ